MLGKLLKYDLKRTFKFLAVFYALAIFFALLTRLLFSLEQNTLIDILSKITMGVTISMIANILINTVMRTFVYFKNNLYGDESYLTNTLPVERETLFLTKFLLTFITLLISFVVITTALLIMYYSKDNFETLKIIFSPLTSILDTTVIKIILAMVVLIFLEVLTMIMCGLVGTILGHKKLRNKIGWSVGYGFGLYIVAQVIVVISILISGVFSPEVNEMLFSQTPMMNVEILKILALISIVVYSLIVTGLYYIGQKNFKKIDVE